MDRPSSYSAARPYQQWLKSGFLFGVYLLTALFGLSFYAVHGFATLIWPPTAVALVALVFWGYGMWPAIALGAFATNILQGAPPPVALGIALGNTLEALAGAYILCEVANLNPLFERIQDSIGMILTAVSVTIISATIGTLSLDFGGVIMRADIPQTWFAWWLGDTLAVLVLAPFLIRWLYKPRFARTGWQIIEGLAMFGLLVAGNYFAFFAPIPALRGIVLIYIFVPMLWISLRGGPRGLTLAILATALMELAGTLSGHGIFGQSNNSAELLTGQLFVGVISIIFFVFVTSAEERKEATRMLETHVDRLEEAVEQISDEDRAKSDFLAILAHELRNPLSPIVSALELIRINGIAAPNATLFETIEVQVQTMGRLLDDLLDITRVSHKKFKLQKESVTLQAVLNRSLNTVNPFIKDRRHKLTVGLPEEAVWLNGDLVRLTQVFVNILFNAAKYTDPGGTITLVCKCEPGQVRVEVADTGIGIEKHMVEKIFEPFVQASDSSSGTAGTGLGIGLALTKRLVELHDGEIYVESKGRGKGSVFIVVLPALEVVQLPMPVEPKRTWEVPSTPAPAAKAYTILIVDDNKPAADVLQSLLRHGGHTARTAYSGQEALREASVRHPDAVILDIGLPDMDGYEVARQLRKELGPSLLLIALSGYGQKEDKDKAFAAGFNYHLTKPVRVEEVEKVLGKRAHK